MDRKHLEATYTAEKMKEAHFQGGFYTSDVQQHIERMEELTPAGRLELYNELFGQLWSMAKELSEHPNYDKETGVLDLSNEGLGSIEIRAVQSDPGDDPITGAETFCQIYVFPRAFNPDVPGELLYRDLVNITVVYKEKTITHPEGWQNGIYLSDRGVAAEDPDRIDRIYLPLSWDYLETLLAIKEVLGEQNKQ